MTVFATTILSLGYLFKKLNQKSLIHQCFGCQILLSYCITYKSKNLEKIKTIQNEKCRKKIQYAHQLKDLN